MLGIPYTPALPDALTVGPASVAVAVSREVVVVVVVMVVVVVVVEAAVVVIGLCIKTCPIGIKNKFCDLITTGVKQYQISWGVYSRLPIFGSKQNPKVIQKTNRKTWQKHGYKRREVNSPKPSIRCAASTECKSAENTAEFFHANIGARRIQFSVGQQS